VHFARGAIRPDPAGRAFHALWGIYSNGVPWMLPDDGAITYYAGTRPWHYLFLDPIVFSKIRRLHRCSVQSATAL